MKTKVQMHNATSGYSLYPTFKEWKLQQKVEDTRKIIEFISYL